MCAFLRLIDPLTNENIPPQIVSDPKEVLFFFARRLFNWKTSAQTEELLP